MKKRFFLIILILAVFSGCAASPVTVPPSEVAPPPAVQDEKLVITAVGDIMMHNSQIAAGYRPATGEYDFSPFFRYVAPLWKESDLVIGNLETTFAGEKEVYSGYPRFNTPEILASDLKEAGFDIVTTANNHCLDKGHAGLVSTLHHLDQAGLLHTGTARSSEERDDVLVVEKKGVGFAVLAYTYSTNMGPEYAYAVNYLDLYKIKKDIKKAREKNARLVIVSLHFGKEYEPQPGSLEKDIVTRVLEAGADVILGHHPHVLQPAELRLYTPAGGSADQKKFIAYSLGNFISDQQGLERRCSIILNLSYGIDRETKQPYFIEATAIPIYTRSFRDKGKLCFEVIPVGPALATIRTGLPHNFTGQDIANLEKSWKHAHDVFTTGGAAVPVRIEQLDTTLDSLTQ